MKVRAGSETTIIMVDDVERSSTPEEDLAKASRWFNDCLRERLEKHPDSYAVVILSKPHKDATI